MKTTPQKGSYPNRIAEVIKSKAKTVDNVAYKSGYTKSFFAKLHEGRIALTMAHARRIAKPIGCKPEELFAVPVQGVTPKQRHGNVVSDQDVRCLLLTPRELELVTELCEREGDALTSQGRNILAQEYHALGTKMQKSVSLAFLNEAMAARPEDRFVSLTVPVTSAEWTDEYTLSYLKALVEQSGSQGAAAKKTGLGQSSISAVLNRQRQPSDDFKARLAAYAGTNEAPPVKTPETTAAPAPKKKVKKVARTGSSLYYDPPSRLFDLDELADAISAVHAGQAPQEVADILNRPVKDIERLKFIFGWFWGPQYPKNSLTKNSVREVLRTQLADVKRQVKWAHLLQSPMAVA
ncbi:MAG: helix-turn-helix transcriptional regulator [Armatimonadetes bacterium]|nr:helix-turn-helix transcriptional regulator [Armatimonadota bacterium]